MENTTYTRLFYVDTQCRPFLTTNVLLTSGQTSRKLHATNEQQKYVSISKLMCYLKSEQYVRAQAFGGIAVMSVKKGPHIQGSIALSWII